MVTEHNIYIFSSTQATWIRINNAQHPDFDTEALISLRATNIIHNKNILLNERKQKLQCLLKKNAHEFALKQNQTQQKIDAMDNIIDFKNQSSMIVELEHTEQKIDAMGDIIDFQNPSAMIDEMEHTVPKSSKREISRNRE